MEKEIYGIANNDNTKFICDIYESDFIKFQDDGIIISDDKKVVGNVANYILSNDKFLELVKQKQICL